MQAQDTKNYRPVLYLRFISKLIERAHVTATTSFNVLTKEVMFLRNISLLKDDVMQAEKKERGGFNSVQCPDAWSRTTYISNIRQVHEVNHSHDGQYNGTHPADIND